MAVPAVSFVVTAYNSARFVRGAIASLLGQSLEGLQVVAVDDASTDGTAGILDEMARHDRRLVVLHNPRNVGPFSSANRALSRVEAPVVARMDSDDLSEPTRAQEQLAFLRGHPAVGIVGSACRVISEEGGPLGLRTFAPADVEIRWASIFACPFQHSTAMIRREHLGEGYDGALRVGGDYDLWSRLLGRVPAANLGAPLVSYRRVSTGITATRRPEQLEAHERIARRALAAQVPGLSVDAQAFSRLRARLDARSGPGPTDPAIARLYLSLFEAFAGRNRGADLGTLSARVRSRASQIERGEP